MFHYTVGALVQTIRDIYEGTEQPDNAYHEEEARVVLEGVIDILHENPDVDVSCHRAETGTPALVHEDNEFMSRPA